MGEPIRIAMIMGKMNGGGVESVVMNYYRHIDRTKVQFDFIIDSDSLEVPKEEIIALGGKIHKVPPYQKTFAYSKGLETIFKKQNYKIIHSHINSLSVFPLRIAKKCGIPIRIAHNHSTAAPGEYKKNVIKYFLKTLATRYPTHYMSPTYYAGEWLFGKKITNNNLIILKNAIDIKKFVFNISTRKKLRKELRYSDSDFVIANIGRMVWQKNQQFAIKVFYEFKKNNSNAKLLIIGDGPLKKELIDLTINLDIEDSVKFVSNVKNIEDYYQAIDYFLFPSNYEGLGMVAVEAQASGLATLVSSAVPEDAKVTSNYYSLDLHQDVKIWAQTVQTTKNTNRGNYGNEIAMQGYDIRTSSNVLVGKYKSMIENLTNIEDGGFNE